MAHENRHIPKLKVDVELTLADGRNLAGQVFVLTSQRVIDLLNGPESFFPFRDAASGKIILFNKAAVSAIHPRDQRG